MKGIYLLMILKLIFAVSATASEHAYSQAVQKMTSDLYLEVAKTSKTENIVISPLSIHTAMAMLHYGAEGNSLKQLRNALGLENLSKDDHLSAVRNLMDEYENLDNENLTLNMANALYGAKNLDVNLNFVNLVENQFDAKYEKIDFSNKKNAVKVINSWAANKTNNLINELVSEEGLDRDVRMVIMNAVYFKAKWMKPFNERGTSLGSFNVPGKGEIQTDFMFLSDSIESASIAELNATLVALPYIDDDYKMLIFHPDESSNIEELEQKLFSSNATIGDYTQQLEDKESKLYFPKFETGSDLSLVKPFKVGDIIHKTKIKVSEEGSEAAAVTGAVLDTRSGPLAQKLNINSPFIFYIQDTKHNIPLFMGKIMNPSKERREDIVFEKDVHDRKFEETSTETTPSNNCPGGDIEACTDDCGYPDTRRHRICIESCAKHCPDMD